MLVSVFEDAGYGLDLLLLPAALFEQNCADYGHCAFSNGYGKERSIRTHVQRNCEPIRQRNLEEPETEKIHDGGSDGLPRAVEGLHHYHKVGVSQIAVADDAQAVRSQRHYFWIVSKEADDRFGKENKDASDRAQENHVVKPSAPHCFLG